MRNDRRFTLISAAVITFAVFLSIAMQGRVRASANEDISGRVVTLDGRGVANAGIFMLLPGGEQRYARANPFDYFRFRDVPTGQALNFSIVHKRLALVHPFTGALISRVETDIQDRKFEDPKDILVLPDGKILVAGYTATTAQTDFAIVRYVNF